MNRRGFLRMMGLAPVAAVVGGPALASGGGANIDRLAIRVASSASVAPASMTLEVCDGAATRLRMVADRTILETRDGDDWRGRMELPRA